MAEVIRIVGVGPGHKDYLTPQAKEALKQADALFGAKRLLETFALPNQDCYSLGSDLNTTVDQIRELRGHKRIAVLVSGDPGIYSLASYLAARFPASDLEMIPGISSVQLMFSRIKYPWQEAAFVSCHGRFDRKLFELVRAGFVIAVLTDSNNTPQAIAGELLANGCPEELPVSVGCNLSYDDELIFRGSLVSLTGCGDKFVNCVVVIGV